MAFFPSAETEAYVDEVVPRYPQARSALLMILHALQKEIGHLPLEAQEWVAARLELTPQQVREVVTFYPFYREHPIGKRHIRVCRTLSCALNGAYRLCDQMCEGFGTKLNEISPDGRVTVEFAECLASCGSAPVMMIGDDLHENVSAEKAAQLIARIKAETPAEPVPQES
jgi:NADH-quinone oxidoreductase subunit E